MAFWQDWDAWHKALYAFKRQHAFMLRQKFFAWRKERFPSGTHSLTDSDQVELDKKEKKLQSRIIEQWPPAGLPASRPIRRTDWEGLVNQASQRAEPDDTNPPLYQAVQRWQDMPTKQVCKHVASCTRSHAFLSAPVSIKCSMFSLP